MKSFWVNILRYPYFFVSSMIGLFLIILKPLIKVTANKPSFIALILGCFIILIWILTQMIYPDF